MPIRDDSCSCDSPICVSAVAISLASPWPQNSRLRRQSRSRRPRSRRCAGCLPVPRTLRLSFGASRARSRAGPNAPCWSRDRPSSPRAFAPRRDNVRPRHRDAARRGGKVILAQSFGGQSGGAEVIHPAELFATSYRCFRVSTGSAEEAGHWRNFAQPPRRAINPACRSGASVAKPFQRAIVPVFCPTAQLIFRIGPSRRQRRLRRGPVVARSADCAAP